MCAKEKKSCWRQSQEQNIRMALSCETKDLAGVTSEFS